jgi:hypothetical protein
MPEGVNAVPPDGAANGPDHMGKPEGASGANLDWSSSDMQTTIATVGVIAVGAALIEVALIPGMVIGVAAMIAPKYVPQIGDALRPAFRSLVRQSYKFGRKARAAAAEAQEQVQDIVAEVHAEDTGHAGTPAA